MTDPLLPWYEKELEFFRQMGAEFARSKPKIAARLNLDSMRTRDPHVERMIQAFAYLNSRIRYKLDDDYPEMTDAMLSVLYPHFLRPVPSMSIIEFLLDTEKADLIGGYKVKRGTPIETERVDDEICRFQTTAEVTLFPLNLTRARLQSLPFAVPGRSKKTARAEGLLKLELTPFDTSANIGDLQVDRLRFHIHIAQYQQAAALYELMFDQLLGIVVASSEDDREPIHLSAEHLQPVGFSDDESLLPWPARSFPGYRLLTEFFAFPHKFLFFDVVFDKSRLAGLGDRLEIYILLENSDPDLEGLVKSDSIRLGCTPIVNLFEQTADAVTLNQTHTEYRIVPDARRESAIEVYSVNEVAVGDESGHVRDYQPFYSVQHGATGDEQAAFWHSTRRPGPVDGDYAPSPHGGTEVYVTLVDTAKSPLRLAGGTLYARTTCLNRDLPMRLRFGGGHPHLEAPEGRGPVASIRCLYPPTETRRRDLRKRNLWRVVSQLSLNHLSIDNSREALETLHEILRLYDLRDSADTRDMIQGLVQVGSRRTAHRVGEVFARGVELSLVFDDEKYAGSSAYMLASVMNHFFGMYTSINSFTRLVATTLRKQSRDERWEWEPRTSDRRLI